MSSLVVKKFGFWSIRLGGLCHRGTFVRFSLFLVPALSKNLINVAPTVKKFKILEDPFEGDSHP